MKKIPPIYCHYNKATHRMNPTISGGLVMLVAIGCGLAVVMDGIYVNNQISSQNVGIFVGIIILNMIAMSCLEK